VIKLIIYLLIEVISQESVLSESLGLLYRHCYANITKTFYIIGIAL